MTPSMYSGCPRSSQTRSQNQNVNEKPSLKCFGATVPTTTSLRLVHLRRCRRGLTPQTTRPPGGDETHLLPGRSVPTHRARVTDMLVVTTTVGMLYRVHGHTTDLQHTQNSLLTTRLAPCTSFPSTLGQTMDETLSHMQSKEEGRRDCIRSDDQIDSQKCQKGKLVCGEQV